MECPRCQSISKVKNGVLNNIQCYKCKDCGCNYTRSYKYYQEKDKKRRFALSMYLEGLGFHSIARLLGVSHVSILNWIRKYGKELESIRNIRPCKTMELDEIHSYVGNKKATDGFGLLLIETPENTLIWSWEAEGQKRKLNYGEKSKSNPQE